MAGDGYDPGRPAPAVSGRVVMLILLALSGGYVDAMSYLGLGNVFTAAMTGNTVLLALAIAQGEGAATIRAGIALVGFVVGVAAAQVVVGDFRPRRTWPCDAGRGLLLEVVPLLVLAAGWQMAGSEQANGARYGLIAASAVAMGIQSAATRGLGIATVGTTYITGTLTSLTSGAIEWLRAPPAPRAVSGGRGQGPSSLAPVHSPVLPALAWMLYAVGAVGGGLMVSYWFAAAPVVPLVIVVLAVVVDIVGHRPANRLYKTP